MTSSFLVDDFFLLSPDKIGLHRVANQSHTKGAVSLHLYTPPYSECKTFNEQCGTARKSGNITFYSVDGKKVERQ